MEITHLCKSSQSSQAGGCFFYYSQKFRFKWHLVTKIFDPPPLPPLHTHRPNLAPLVALSEGCKIKLRDDPPPVLDSCLNYYRARVLITRESMLWSRGPLNFLVSVTPPPHSPDPHPPPNSCTLSKFPFIVTNFFRTVIWRNLPRQFAPPARSP